MYLLRHLVSACSRLQRFPQYRCTHVFLHTASRCFMKPWSLPRHTSSNTTSPFEQRWCGRTLAKAPRNHGNHPHSLKDYLISWKHFPGPASSSWTQGIMNSWLLAVLGTRHQYFNLQSLVFRYMLDSSTAYQQDVIFSYMFKCSWFSNWLL